MTRSRGLIAALGLIALGLAILAMPAAWEGPVLVPISDGHAIAAADAIGILPLVAGTTLLYVLMWRERQQAATRLQTRPLSALGLAFGGGVGLGLLVASAFSAWYWWWAMGAALFGAALLVAGVTIVRAPAATR
jgi:hypothetical protein